MMKKAIILLALAAIVQGAAAQVRTGLDVLEERQFDILQGKRIGLCTNPTGIDAQLRQNIDVFFEAPEVNLVALYGPEHGVRGNVHAGDKVDTEVDTKTGLRMYSLYGKTRKPTPEMLAGVDAIVYDIQDIGCRSFTFISTLGKLMEACAEADKELIVLDRPNPLGGNKIEGNIVEKGFISFVSQFEIPYIYGQTPGELALYLNAQNGEKCRLTVVPMEGWTRDMTWDKTGLTWVAASPHIPHGETSMFYPATGIFGEFGYVNIGVGYTLPFELMGAPWISADTLSEALNNRQVPGVYFRPIHYKPFYSVFKGEQIQGVQIHITDYEAAQLSAIQFIIIEEIMRLWPEHDIFANCDKKRFSMFDKVCGSDQIRNLFGQHYRWADIADYWNKDVKAYREESAKYYLY